MSQDGQRIAATKWLQERVRVHPELLRKAEESKRKREQQGREAWAWWHATAERDALTPELEEKEFRPMIPRYGCVCLSKWKDILKKAPPMPAVDQRQWAIDRHNDVNLEIGKPVWTPNEKV